MKTRINQNVRLGLDSLEARDTPVVGAFAVPAPLSGSSFDGVVRLIMRDAAGNSMGSCSGSLLSSGRHILTAAHCLTNDRGVINSASTDVIFQLNGRTEMINVPRAGYVVHPNWNGGDDDNYNADVALLKLPQLAPLDADRYDLYRLRDERGKTTQIVGYGRTGIGARGDNVPADGNRRMATNRIDGVEYSTFLGIGGRAGNDGTILHYDFDRVGGEGILAPGDSGGAMFIGGRLAGINSTTWETTFLGGKPENEFGEVGAGMRVSTYASWIDRIVNSYAPVTIDLNKEAFANNGVADTIEIRNAGTNLELYVNLSLRQTFDARTISEVTLRGTGDAERFTLPALTQTRVVLNGLGGSDTLTGRDSANTFTLQDADLGILNQHSFVSIENLNGGSLSDVFRFELFGRITGKINGGFGTDRLDYSTFGAGVIVDLDGGTATRVARGITSIEDVTGTAFRDLLYGSNSANTIRGGAGNDLIQGLGGTDYLYGDAGLDRLFGGLGKDYLFGGSEDDFLDGGKDNLKDQLWGHTGRDTFVRYRNDNAATLIVETEIEQEIDFTLFDIAKLI